ncbi:amino acid permease [Burkholderia thailandensis]|uniref:amino acid permease n=1 Tax=Burkholderia thailandensis TaxID=57975 RepID=UPI0005B70BEA|nr:amino acid permease [Burkholderia thailandensis]AVR07429.1 amino acid permease [Burkholderia thailandensis]KIS55314.1 amino acid permease family protein [Burkholderia thailandensis Phuket 4W-1]
MSSEKQFHAIAAREGGLRRTLSARQMTMIAIGGAIGTGLFLGSGFAIGFAGPSVLISYAIGALISLLLMGCLAEMTVAHPISGSFGAHAEHYLGPWAGFLVRYAYWACIVLAVGTEVTAVALYMKYWLPAVPGWIWIASFSAVLVCVNALSVDVFGSVEYGFSVVKIAAIVAFIAIGGYVVFVDPSLVADPNAGAPGLRHYFAHGGFFPKGLWGMWVAVIVSIFSYLSIEMIAVAAGEAQDPERAVTRAFRSTVIRLVLFYLVTLALMLAIVPWTAAGRDESPFVKVMIAIHLPGAAGVINFVVLIAALSAMNSQLYITTRMMFSLACAGHAPRGLGRLTSRGVPLNALLLSTAGIAIATLVSIVYPDASFTIMMAISMFGAMFTWTMIFVTHYFFRRKRAAQGLPPPRFRMPGFPFATLAGAALMLAIMATTYFTAEFHMTLVFGVPFLVALSVLYFARYRRRPPALAQAESLPR